VPCEHSILRNGRRVYSIKGGRGRKGADDQIVAVMMMWTLSMMTFIFYRLASANYPCSGDYAGNCRDCRYNDGICHLQLPTVVYTNGKIYTVQTDTDWHGNPPNTMVVEQKNIVFVGFSNEASQWMSKSGAKIVDLEGRAVFPGDEFGFKYILFTSFEASTTFTCIHWRWAARSRGLAKCRETPK